MPADNEDNLVSKGNPDYVERNKRKIIELAKNKEAKEIKVTCPHCSKELYIERATDQCVYCKKPLSEDLITNMFLRYEDLESENKSKQQSRKNLCNKNVTRSKFQIKHLFILVAILIIPLCIYGYNTMFSSFDSSDQYGDANSDNVYSVLDINLPTLTGEKLASLYMTLDDMYEEFSSLGMSYRIHGVTGAVVLNIDTSQTFGTTMKDALNNKKETSWADITFLLDTLENKVSSEVGYDFYFVYIFDSDMSNIIYSVVDGQAVKDAYYTY